MPEPMRAIGAPADGWVYYGEHRDWLVAGGWWKPGMSAQRTLDESNARTMAKLAEAAGAVEDEDFAFESFGGAFGPGWYYIVRPGSEAERVAIECHERMEDYPALDEEDWYFREEEDARQSIEEWARCEYPSLDAADLSGWVIHAWMESGTRELPGTDMTGWPDRDDPEDRPLIASAIRQYRNYRRKEKASA